MTRTLTETESRRLLKVTYDHRAGLRDHVIFTLALKTGLREHEILALNVGDVFGEGGAKRWVQLHTFKRSNQDAGSQQVALNDMCREKLHQLINWKRRKGEDLSPGAPLFISRNHNRLSCRQLRHAFKVWQGRAAFERLFKFHALRHTACTNLYQAKKDVKLVQKFARHKSVVSTSIYTHSNDSDLAKAVELI